MTDVLARILADKRQEVARRERARATGAMMALAATAPEPRGFASALARAAASGPALIAEIKKASPSHGLIRADFDPAWLARAYVEGGAACLSILTDGPYFQGEDRHVAEARNVCDLPILRKDFTIDSYQVIEARVIGADCILLIMAALEDAMARDLAATARAVGLDILVEVHDEAELDRAAALDADLIGINNRDLKTLATDLATSERLAPRVGPGRAIVAESGIKTHADLARLGQAGIRRFLVGESLMREKDVAQATRRLIGRDRLSRAAE
jgi:indole-3-glycerol phosphate synthase